MEKDRSTLWVFYALALLGFWLLASPATFAFRSFPLIVSNLICGTLLILIGLRSRRSPRGIAIWSIAAIGIWMQFAPLIFWAPEAAAYLNDTLVGAWIIALPLAIRPFPGQLPDVEPSIPPGWSYNPSSWPQRVIIAFLAFVCWMISRYLAAYQLGYIDAVWDPFFTPGTKSVLESDVSKAFPVSDAGLGALAYTIEFFSACIGGRNRWRTAPWLVLVFGVLVIPVSLVSVILIILQPTVVGTWCTLCLTTAVCMLIAIPFAVGEVAAALQYLKHSKEKPFFTLLFKGGLCPGAAPDRLTPPMDSSLLSLFKSALSGITCPWNLVLSTLSGIFLMAIPGLFHLRGLMYDLDPILGALAAVVSVISMSEYARKSRLLLLAPALALLISTWIAMDQPILHTAVAILIAALSIRKGPILESCEFK